MLLVCCIDLCFYVEGMEMADNESLEEQIHNQLSKTEITLTLSNKFEVPDDDNIDMKTLLIR